MLIIVLILLVGVAILSIRFADYKPVLEASAVIKRVLPEYHKQFRLEMIDKENGKDVFELEPGIRRIIIRGSSGVALCSGFNFYLKEYCNVAYNFRTGSNLNFNGELNRKFPKIRKATPYEYRYIFNYCTFSYSTPFWDWDQWEKMIDWMAMNGINMPLAPIGQEIIWQRVYKKFNINEQELEDFFVGPAYNAFGRMGCLDGYGGPLPQEWIKRENKLQKRILKRSRNLGMSPILQGFTGHVPYSLIKKNPSIKYSTLNWVDFPQTYLLDWEDPLFMKIAKEYYSELSKEYGTDHLYAIDQFIEMKPVGADTTFLKNMSKTVISSILQEDPEGKWILQTWPFRYDTGYWVSEKVKAYLDGVADDHMIALELTGESWQGTGWYRHDGWYGKPWIWCVLQNFGDRVSIYGGLTQIAENINKTLGSDKRGDLSGIGLIMEGLDYNPVIYNYVTDITWSDTVPDLKLWKENFLRSRYGQSNALISEGWNQLFEYYYTQLRIFEKNPIIERPKLINNDIWPSKASLLAAECLINASEEFAGLDTYQFDITNLFRQVFGQYAGHLLFEISNSYKDKNIEAFDRQVNEYKNLCLKIEQLLSTREEFLLDKWLYDSKKHATTPEEEQLYEWNAKAIITVWGGRRLYGYAIKDWAGMYTNYFIPKWDLFFNELKGEILGLGKYNDEEFLKSIISWEDSWLTNSLERVQLKGSDETVPLARALWNQYGEILMNHAEMIIETNPE